jgi:hypothetical protein
MRMSLERARRVSVELRYLGGTLPEDARDALAHAIAAELGALPEELSFRVVASQHLDALEVAATVRLFTAVGAIAWIDAATDRALWSTGLFEEFDATGKVLRVAPRELLG